jgi:hypothetical protein
MKMTDQELALIVLQQGKPQQVLAKFLNLMLNYQYGLSIVVAPDLTKAASLLSEHAGKVRCVCDSGRGDLQPDQHKGTDGTRARAVIPGATD